MYIFIEGSTRTILLPAECRDCSWDGVECLTRLRLNNGLAVCTVSGGWGGGEGRPKWPGKEIRKLSWFLITFCELNVIFMCVREYVVRVCTSHVCIQHVCSPCWYVCAYIICLRVTSCMSDDPCWSVCVCVHTLCLSVCVYPQIDTHIYTHVCTCIFVHGNNTHACTHIHAQSRKYNIYTYHAQKHPKTHPRTATNQHLLYARMYTYGPACIYVYKHACT